MTTAHDAAYRALAPYRISAAHRRAIAEDVVAVLVRIPVEMLPNVVALGESAGIVGDIHNRTWTVPVGRRRSAITAAVASAVEALTANLPALGDR